MPKRIVKDTIVLHREGKQVVPEIGQLFDFTADELNSINKANPAAVQHIVTTDPAPVEKVEPAQTAKGGK